MRTKSSALRAKEEFLALYHDGKFEPGTRIPSESSMAEMLGVSRETWRKALGLLRGDGIVYSRHGSGTYLTEKRHRIANDLSQLKSLSRMIAEAGLVEEGSSMPCTRRGRGLLRSARAERVCHPAAHPAHGRAGDGGQSGDEDGDLGGSAHGRPRRQAACSREHRCKGRRTARRDQVKQRYCCHKYSKNRRMRASACFLFLCAGNVEKCGALFGSK